MAIAKENSDLSQLNSSAIGIWNMPKEDRIAKLTSIITQPTTNTDVNIEFLAIMLSFLGVTLKTNSVNLYFVPCDNY